MASNLTTALLEATELSALLLTIPSTSASLEPIFSVRKYEDYNKVRELATVCSPWQQWTEKLVWFDDVGISAFHSCVVFDLWQSLCKWRLLLSECVSVCRRENVGA
jgi:hypothetical protein